MKKLLVAVALLASLNLAQAQVNNFTITLSGAAERPTPNASTGTGSGTATLSGNQVTYSVSWSGLGSAPSGAHIHGPADINNAAGVIHPFSPAPSGTSGSLNQTFTYTAGQLTELQNGLHYFNIHTATFPGGELRGQVLPIPEPGVTALMAVGAALMAWRFRRRS